MNVMLYCNDKFGYEKIKRDIKANEHVVLVSTNIELLDSNQINTTGIALDSENVFF